MVYGWQDLGAAKMQNMECQYSVTKYTILKKKKSQNLNFRRDYKKSPNPTCLNSSIREEFRISQGSSINLKMFFRWLGPQFPSVGPVFFLMCM